MSCLPTEPGPYWWKEPSWSDWRLLDLLDYEVRSIPEDFQSWSQCWLHGVFITPDGQWQRCIRPDELATLQAKAEAYDKGQTMWMSFDADTKEPYAVDKDVAVVTHDTWKLLDRSPLGVLPGGFIKRRVRIINETQI